MTERELLRLHIEAVWGLTLPALDPPAEDFVVIQGMPPWSLYLATFRRACAQEQVTIGRAGIEQQQRRLLQAQAGQVGLVWDQTLRMRREAVFHYPRISPRQEAHTQDRTRMLTAEDADLINTFEVGSAAYFLNPRMGPCVGVMVEGRLVSIAHSSRRTASACELGINTRPDARRRGFAAAATTLWTDIVHQQGLVPIYSAFAWNTASLRLAQSIGYRQCIDGVYGPVPETAE